MSRSMSVSGILRWRSMGWRFNIPTTRSSSKSKLRRQMFFYDDNNVNFIHLVWSKTSRRLNFAVKRWQNKLTRSLKTSRRKRERPSDSVKPQQTIHPLQLRFRLLANFAIRQVPVSQKMKRFVGTIALHGSKLIFFRLGFNADKSNEVVYEFNGTTSFHELLARLLKHSANLLAWFNVARQRLQDGKQRQQQRWPWWASEDHGRAWRNKATIYKWAFDGRRAWASAFSSLNRQSQLAVASSSSQYIRRDEVRSRGAVVLGGDQTRTTVHAMLEELRLSHGTNWKHFVYRIRERWRPQLDRIAQQHEDSPESRCLSLVSHNQGKQPFYKLYWVQSIRWIIHLAIAFPSFEPKLSL